MATKRRQRAHFSPLQHQKRAPTSSMAVVFPPESPRKASKSREVDSLSLESSSDLDSIKLAMHSVFEAAVALDTLLADVPTDDVIPDDASFASEERRLIESEEELRKALDSIEQDETDSIDAPCLSREPLDAFSAESYESPETQVPLLQPVSPFGSPFSDNSSIPSPSKRSAETFANPASVLPEAPVAVARSPSKKRQVRAYGLRPHVKDEGEVFVDLEASLEQLSPKGRDITAGARIMANALFGRTEYSVRPVFATSTEKRKRTVQGTVSVLLASGIVVVDRARESQHVVFLVLLLPVLVAALQSKLPHQVDETILAVMILGTHVTMSHLSVLQEAF